MIYILFNENLSQQNKIEYHTETSTYYIAYDSGGRIYRSELIGLEANYTDVPDIIYGTIDGRKILCRLYSFNVETNETHMRIGILDPATGEISIIVDDYTSYWAGSYNEIISDVDKTYNVVFYIYEYCLY